MCAARPVATQLFAALDCMRDGMVKDVTIVTKLYGFYVGMPSQKPVLTPQLPPALGNFGIFKASRLDKIAFSVRWNLSARTASGRLPSKFSSLDVHGRRAGFSHEIPSFSRRDCTLDADRPNWRAMVESAAVPNS